MADAHAEEPRLVRSYFAALNTNATGATGAAAAPPAPHAQPGVPDPAPSHSSVSEALSRPDIVLEILSRLPSLPDLVSACGVGRAWAAAAAADLPWRRLYIKHFGRPEPSERCRSYREQCARHMGLRWPHPPPPRLPPPPATTTAATTASAAQQPSVPASPAPRPLAGPTARPPGGPQDRTQGRRQRQRTLPLGALERYDEMYGAGNGFNSGGGGGGGLYGIRTLAVSYDPVTRCLLRAVRCRALLGDDTRVAVQAVALEWEEEVEAEEEVEEVEEEAEAGEAGEGAREGAGKAVAGAAGAETAAGAGVIAGRYVDATSCAVPRWVCWLSVDGRPPPPPLPPDTEHESHGPEDQQDPKQQEEPAAAVAGVDVPPVAPRRRLTAVESQQLAALADLLPAVMCAAGGRLYLPAGARGQELAVWDLAAALAGAPPATAPPPAGAAACGEGEPGGDLRSPHCWLTTDGEDAEEEEAAAHPGRLLAAAADGSLAVSGCDGGVLRFWHGGSRRLLGSGDIRALTLLPPVPLAPQTSAAARAGAPGLRHLLRLALSESSGLAAAALASPLAPSVHVFRAAAAAAGSGAAAAATPARTTGWPSVGAGAGGAGGGVGECVRVLTPGGGAPVDGLALFRGCLVASSTLCSDVMGARFGGSGGSSLHITVTASAWRLPRTPEQQQQQEQEEEDRGRAPGGGCGGGGEGDPSGWGEPVRLYSSRLQLEHPRTLVLGRLRPVLLAAAEDLLLLPVPRNVGGRPPHQQLLALSHPFGDCPGGDEEPDEEEEQGAAPAPVRGAGSGASSTSRGTAAGAASRAGAALYGAGTGPGSGKFVVLSEEERLPWIEVVEDAGGVLAAALPAPRHLVLLRDDGRVGLLGILPP
ncbi:hypothetical protein HXX76_008443 [Chlamydomonas incerta]|uniref:F-box domain-containing protein n=1 Tax=Chlamydomonas incerta TaxID=51695 RepID=A0A835SXP1_CHLIN|nr:hypothetical protein HXX76_008443 [Chlamydomonas incerta]|eukprot:KAG2433382.1 hypothetical protein HXX76_008443 [Chlamydomonas incerta]